MASESRIGCVVPTLNSGATLDTALQSLASQQARLSVIVADSGSTDATLEICHRRQVPVIYVPPGNMYRAINAGLRELGADWLMYLNSDDWLYSDALARLVELGERERADVVYGNSDFVDAAGRFRYSMAAARPAQVLPLFRRQIMGFTPHSAIFRQELFERHRGFDESYTLSSDADFFARLVRANEKFARLSGPPVACFRLHAGQQTQTRAGAMQAERERIFGAAEMRPGPGDYFTEWAWRARNLPHYGMRFLRASLLARRIVFPRSLSY